MWAVREIIGEMIYYLVRPLVFYGGFLLILFGVAGMLLGAAIIVAFSVKSGQLPITATINDLDGKRFLIGLLIWVGIIVIFLLARKPWEDYQGRFEKEEKEERSKLLLLFPKWLPAYEGMQSPIHLFPFFWHAYCPRCKEKGQIEVWNTFRYFACRCSYKWTAQDNIIA